MEDSKQKLAKHLILQLFQLGIDFLLHISGLKHKKQKRSRNHAFVFCALCLSAIKPGLAIKDKVNYWQAPVNPNLEQVIDFTILVFNNELYFKVNQLVALCRIMLLHNEG